MSVHAPTVSPKTTLTTHSVEPGFDLHELNLSASDVAGAEPPSDEPATEASAAVPDTRSFLDAISAIELAFTIDRKAAIAMFRPALDLATDADWDVLDFMVECFTLYPRESALLRLRARWSAGDETERERLVRLVPDTDPGLHSHDNHALAQLIETRARTNRTSVAEEFAKFQVQLAAAEMPRQSIRTWRNPLPRLTMPASRRIDAARLDPEQIRARVLARGKRRPAEPEPVEVTAYVRESLFVDTEVVEQARLRRRWAELIARGVTLTAGSPRGWTPRRPGERAPLPADLAEAMWDHQYCVHVAYQRDHDRALAAESTKSPEHSHAWAAERTGLRSRADRREGFVFQGNGLDDFATAMTPVAGWRCVSCFVERPTTDQRPVHVRDGVRRSDDGLCDYCRGDNRTGLPALPDGFTTSNLAIAYCTYFVEHYRDAAYRLITEVCRRAPEWLINVIDKFLAAHPDLPGAPQPVADDADPEYISAPTASKRRRGPVVPPGQRPGRCEGCTRYTPVHDDGFCTQCRVHLGLHIPTPRERRLVAA
ncbi:hypothetical protein [Nocardia neocaledoniensis]|uniref:hypothetical protein n=1 Tax=Nocardia neocaledoniensis TaxID=236511 RepID=UPI0024566533|nr:hypothetical protein [Nocardia neocaledoniensis]